MYAQYALTKYNNTKGSKSVKRSDHYTLLANFDIDWEVTKRERTEVFKLRDEEGLSKLHDLTSHKGPLNRCLENVELQEACKRWYKEFEKLLHQCFKKVRITERPPRKSIEYPVYNLMTENRTVKKLLTLSMI